MAGAPYRVAVDRLGGNPTFGRGELIDGLTAAAMRLEVTRLAAAGAIVGLGPDPVPLVAGYTGTGALSARPAVPDVPEGATAFYFATDTGALSTWDGTSWSDSAAQPLKFENWDGVVAPAIPAGWQVTGPVVTSTANSPTSAPNSLVWSPATNAAGVATWGTPDNAGGNVQVSATAHFADTAGAQDQEATVFARGSGTEGTRTQYFGGLYTAPYGLYLSKIVNAVQTNLVLLSISGWTDATNYRVVLSCSGSTIKMRCQRLSDGSALSSDGTFVADPTQTTWAIVVTDTAIPAASGLAGVGFYTQDAVGGLVGVDDWLLEAL